MPSSEKSKPHFRVSPAVFGPLGMEQLHDPALAVLELIKNSWDADANRVKIAVEQRTPPGRILVNDDGHGMTEDEFRDRWLVVGASHKRNRDETEGGRPLIGEKGLGRLASFALGDSITIESARKSGHGFAAEVDWKKLSASKSLEDYEIGILPSKVRRGTRIQISDLKGAWSSSHTEFLITHAGFLTSVPGTKFRLSLRVDGRPQPIEDALATIERLAEGSLELQVGPDGTPKITKCVIDGTDETRIVFREMKRDQRDTRLAGVRLALTFFRRDEAVRRLSDVLPRNEVTDVLERYQGVRIFRDGINVPPYGINQDDWAGLEKQRTSTGGPTLVPGNSQLVGELHVSRKRQPHLVITAGRSGFADQSAVGSLANYVRWAVRELGTARRAQYLGITGSGERIPTRIDEGKGAKRAEGTNLREVLAVVLHAPAVKADPVLSQRVARAAELLSDTLNENEQTLRLYAQLASTGIAATSFSHELRADFDIVSEAVAEITASRLKPDQELIELLNASWSRIKAFAGLFKVIPVKIRRRRMAVSSSELRTSARAILGLAPPDKVKPQVSIPTMKLKLVPAEVDSILLNLVSNAVKAIAESRNRKSGIIRVAYEARGADLAMRVADNGCGITRKVREIMFEPLEGRFAEGTGMGLPIVKYIAERYKGTVTVQNPAPQGCATEFVVILRNVVE